MTYMDGGESLFGEYWGAMIGWVKDNEDALRSLWDMLVLGMSYLIEFGFFVTKYLGGALIDVVVAIIAAFELLVSLFSGNTAAIKENWDAMCMALLSAFTNLAMLFDPLVNWIAGLFVKAFTVAKDYVLEIFSNRSLLQYRVLFHPLALCFQVYLLLLPLLLDWHSIGLFKSLVNYQVLSVVLFLN